MCAWRLTELFLKKKKRGVLAYTPVGAVAKLGTDALKETLSKVDIIEMSFEAELVDSMSSDVLAAIVIPSGARKADDQKEERMDMKEFQAQVQEYASRLSCQLDNAKLPESGAHQLHRSKGPPGPRRHGEVKSAFKFKWRIAR